MEIHSKKKIIRATTVPMSLTSFCSGMLKELSEKYEVVALSSPDKELEEIRESDGVRTIAVPMERHISLIKDFVALVRMVKVFNKEKPYAVHSMTPKAGMLCMLAAWLTRVPVRIHMFTGLVWPTAVGMKRKILMATDWLTCACATHVIPEGKGVMHDLQEHITKKPMKVLGYGNARGVDMEYYSRRSEVMRKADEIRRDDVFTFIFVGRIVGDKGINELVEAFLLLLERHKDIRLLLIGRFEEDLDPLQPKTKELIDTTEEIVAMGPQYGDDLLACYAASDCFVFPSYREGFPNTVLEAGAMGLPSIVTDINGSNEIVSETPSISPRGEFRQPSKVRDNSLEFRGESLEGRDDVRVCRNGMIIPSKDTGTLYEAMLRMVEDDDAREMMASNARGMIEQRFEKSFVRKCLFEFYDEVI